MPNITDNETVLGFRTTGTKQSAKEIASLAKELTNLQKAINKIEFGALKSQWKVLGYSKDTKDMLSRFTKNEQKNTTYTQAQAKTAITEREAQFDLDRNQKTTDLFYDRLEAQRALTDATYQQQLQENIIVTTQQQQLNNYTKQNAKVEWMEQHLPEIVEQEKRRQEINNKIAKASGKQQTSLQKLGNTFKRIGFYRLARRFFSVIEQGLSEGVSSFAKFDSNANATMSSITSSFAKITASVGAIITPLIQIFEPLISAIGTAFAEIANGISKTVASMKGLGTYTKVNTEYMKKYGEETNKSLTSFDKFETLSGAQDTNDIYSTEEVVEAEEGLETVGSEIAKLFVVIKNVIDQIVTFLKPYLPKIIKVFSVVIEIIAKIAKILEPIINALLNLIGPLVEYFGIVIDEFMPLLKFLANIIAVVVKVITAVINFFSNILGKIFNINTPAQTATPLATGGVPDKGSLFYAGEAGAELVHSMPSGNTGVTNVAQFKQAMVEAIYECSDVFYSGEGNVVLNLDGAEIARSRRFKAEMNRTNSGLNLV